MGDSWFFNILFADTVNSFIFLLIFGVNTGMLVVTPKEKTVCKI